METRSRILLTLAATTAFALAGCTGVGMFEGPQTREIEFWVEEMDWELHPEVKTKVWAFCAQGDGVEPVHGDEPCGVPGPTVHVNEGDRIKLTFRNTHAIPHTVHFHGWHKFAADMNGNALIGDAMVADPGETEIIEWTAEPAGSFIYHCHFETPTHMEMGMYGAFIVHAKDEVHPDVEAVTVLDEWDVRRGEMLGNIPAYDFFTINGKSFPLTQPIVADRGDHVRIHMVNAGYEFHAMHIHGYTPDSWEGVAGAEHAVPTDVREIAPGQTVVLDFDAVRDGVWLFHDHVVPRVTAGSDGNGFGAYPRGMLTVLVVGDDYLQAVQDIVPDLLAAAQGDVDHPDAAHDEDDGHDADGADGVDGTDGADEPDDAGGETVVVAMKDFVYADEELVIEAGTKVIWRNDDAVYHTVTFDDGSVDSGQIQAGKLWSHTFDEPGEYPYYCKPHAYQGDDGAWQGMTAKVVVQ